MGLLLLLKGGGLEAPLIQQAGQTFAPALESRPLLPRIDQAGRTFTPFLSGDVVATSLIDRAGGVRAPQVLGPFAGRTVVPFLVEQAGRAVAPTVVFRPSVPRIDASGQVRPPLASAAVFAVRIDALGQVSGPDVRPKAVRIDVAFLDASGVAFASIRVGLGVTTGRLEAPGVVRAIVVVQPEPPPRPPVAYRLDLYDLAGGLVVRGARFVRATATWDLDGPGSLEVALRPADVSAWVPLARKVVLVREETPVWGGFLLALEASFDPDEGAAYMARALGYAAPLDGRVVLGDFSRVETAATEVAWALIQHAQSQPYGGLGIIRGTVTGTAPAVTRHFCDGDNIREAIDDLASREPGGFDWEVDAAGRWNAWVGGRGRNLAAEVSFGPEHVRELEVTWDGSDLATFAHAIGEDPEGPCGPPVVSRAGALAAAFLRRDAVVELSTRDGGELAARADHELTIRARSRLRCRTTVEERHDPAGLKALELGDRVTVNLPAVLGGPQVMRVISRQVTMEPGFVHHWEHEFEVVS